MPLPMPPFDFDSLRSFVAIIDHGGFGAAAGRIGRTQSTISLQIKKLEDGLGAAVLQREGTHRRQPVSLTPAGEILLAYARQILHLADEARERIMAPDAEGTVRLGTPEDFATWHLPDILARFAQAHPRVLLEVHCDFTVNLLSGFSAGRYDLVLFKREPQQQPLPSGPGIGVWREALVWVAGGRWNGQRLPGSVPLVLAPAPDIYRKRALAALDRINRPWRVAYSSPSLAGLHAAVRAGLGITVLPRAMVEPDMRVLTEEQGGLPSLPDAEIVLYRAPGAVPSAVEKLASHIIHSLEAAMPSRNASMKAG